MRVLGALLCTLPHAQFARRSGSGVCPERPDSDNLYEIGADVLDADWNDVAARLFRKTVRFGLANLACRPAKVTLRTAPRFCCTILVPRAPAKAGK
jgi:hypothetical protein